MQQDGILQIGFDRAKHPDWEFDLLLLENIWTRTDLDHSPLLLHRVSFYLMLVITEGSGTHTIDFRDYSYEKGTILTIRKDQVHRFHELQKAEGVKGYLMLFTEEFLVSYFEKTESARSLNLFNELLGAPRLQLGEGNYEATLALIKEIQSEFRGQNDEFSPSVVRSLIQILVSRLYRIKSLSGISTQDKKYTSQFLEFQRLVEGNGTKNRNVSFYAEALATTPKMLNKLTKAIVHKTAKSFINELVTLQIKRKLIQSSLTITEIAYQTGFEEPTNLYKFFKRHTGHTPEAFRRYHQL